MKTISNSSSRPRLQGKLKLTGKKATYSLIFVIFFSTPMHQSFILKRKSSITFTMSCLKYLRFFKFCFFWGGDCSQATLPPRVCQNHLHIPFGVKQLPQLIERLYVTRIIFIMALPASLNSFLLTPVCQSAQQKFGRTCLPSLLKPVCATEIRQNLPSFAQIFTLFSALL